MRRLLPILLAGCWISSAGAAIVGPPKRPAEDLPTDCVRLESQLVFGNRHDYVINLQGTIDGIMTRPPVGYGATKQVWQPNRSVTIENNGDAEIRNPRSSARAASFPIASACHPNECRKGGTQSQSRKGGS